MLSILRRLPLLACIAPQVEAAFKIYDAYTPAELQAAHGISSSCSDALNMTLSCDESNMSRAAEGIDMDYWYKENITSLCTASCSTSLQTWLSAIEKSCSSNTLDFMGSIMQAKTVPVVFKSAYDIACLQDSKSSWCFFDSQHWQGREYNTYDEEACWNDDESPDSPECDEYGALSGNVSASMMDVTRMYDRELLCDECFVKMWRQRLLNPFLQEGRSTTYLLEQYQSIQKNCSMNLPITTSSSTLFVSLAYTDVPGEVTPSPTTSGSAPAATTCVGQLINPPKSGEFVDCLKMAEDYKVPLGDIYKATGDPMCQFNTSICLPKSCEGEVIWDGQSCAQLAAQYSSDKLNVTEMMFLSWNPNIVGDCSRLKPGQRVCSRPPGGQFTPTGVIYAPTAAGSYYSTASAAAPTRTGTTASCGLYHTVVSGDTCNSVALRYGIKFQTIKDLNNVIDDTCTNLWLDYAICVAPVTQAPKSSDGTCGPGASHATCEGTAFGSCCSTSGYCGSNIDYCGAGNCASGACSGDGTGVTTDGTCSPTISCNNPSFGPCCSTSGYCGSTKDYCGPGNCSSGACDANEGGLSTDGSCGPNFAGNKICTGTQFGSCCSNYGYCGSTDDYCSASNCHSGACQSI
ncbi:carbohydrate-binding module family 18 protein [Paraphoma chrysanthemicola]|uniref:Carbohydrate-binding module family 18 protein n=1 Tax=Paraphoma chrysanthemicola TaxID=798071 RepID=A0A8K0VSD9_9PLEO|nr:carbohydrate-binding module family 18 protein [Paraphoma chrysanthemicola]